MSFSINYNSNVSSDTISAYLASFASAFGDVGHTNGNVDDNNSGGFYGGGFFDGTQYGITSTANETSAVLAEGDLNYTFFTSPAHTLYGDLDTVTLGDSLQGGSLFGTAYSIADVGASFDGLDLSSASSEGHSGTVHQVIYGLMEGDVDPLEAALADIFDGILSVTDSLSNAASIFNTATFAGLDDNSDGTITEAEITAYASASVATVGVHEDAGDLALAA